MSIWTHGLDRLEDCFVEKNLCFRNYAQLVQVGIGNLTRIFKKETRKAVCEYIAMFRSVRLRKLIQKPDHPRAHLAQQLCL